eukprot:scaffold143868_cov45-Tisochrysis_lutea.AAC.1
MFRCAARVMALEAIHDLRAPEHHTRALTTLTPEELRTLSRDAAAYPHLAHGHATLCYEMPGALAVNKAYA